MCLQREQQQSGLICTSFELGASFQVSGDVGCSDERQTPGATQADTSHFVLMESGDQVTRDKLIDHVSWMHSSATVKTSR